VTIVLGTLTFGCVAWIRLRQAGPPRGQAPSGKGSGASENQDYYGTRQALGRQQHF